MSGHSIVTGFQKTSDGTPTQAQLDDNLNLKVITSSTDLTTEFDYVGGSNVIYLGQAVPGSAIGTAVWRIRKFTYDGSNNVLSMTYANGNGNFTNVWADRATYTYI